MGTLSAAPPLPSNLQPSPQPSLNSLAGSSPNAGTPAGSGSSMQSSVIEKLMFAEKALKDAAAIMPPLSAVIDGVISQLRQGAGKVLVSQQSSGQSPVANGTGVAPAPAIFQGGQ